MEPPPLETMKLTALEEYGIRCMLQFARQRKGEGPPGNGRSLTIGEIAEIEGLTPQYTGKLIRILRMGGLLESVRGRHGGYKLGRPAEQISVGEVMAVLGGRVYDPGYCSRHTGARKLCVHSVDCAIRSLWGALQEAVDKVLSKITLKDLIGPEAAVGKWLGVLGEADELRVLAACGSGSPADAAEAAHVEGAQTRGLVEVTTNARPRQREQE